MVDARSKELFARIFDTGADDETTIQQEIRSGVRCGCGCGCGCCVCCRTNCVGERVSGGGRLGVGDTCGCCPYKAGLTVVSERSVSVRGVWVLRLLQD